MLNGNRRSKHLLFAFAVSIIAIFERRFILGFAGSQSLAALLLLIPPRHFMMDWRLVLHRQRFRYRLCSSTHLRADFT